MEYITRGKTTQTTSQNGPRFVDCGDSCCTVLGAAVSGAGSS